MAELVEPSQRSGGTRPKHGAVSPEISGTTLTSRQTEVARTIIGVGKGLGLPQRAWVLAVAGSMQESGLRDLANPSVPASMTLPHDGVSQEQVPDLGPFQFVSGSVAQRMDVARSAGEFYARLTAIPAWQGMPAARAIQTALTSASPNPFAKWLGPAALLVMNHRNAPAVAPPNKLHQRAL